MPGRWWMRVGSMLVVGAACLGASAYADEAADAKEREYYELMKSFVDTFEQIERNYVKPVDRRELLEAAVQGMLTRLDPYSSYIDENDFAQFNQSVEQEFGGIGIQVGLDPKTRQLMVMTPLPGTPAYKAGIRAGDRIVEIDEKPTAEFPEGKEMESAVKLMKGPEGTNVKVSVLHQGEAKPVVLEITRAVIRTPTVLGDRYDADGDWLYFLEGQDKIAYVRLSQFSRNSAEEVHDVIEKLHKDGMKGLILDLRFNPGGLLTAATAISDLFVDSGVIVSTKGRNTEEQVFKARKAGTYDDFPMVVLVNHFSASASEIVSACLQDHHRALVVGERSWGKGSVQNVIDLEGGKTALKLTTASYHRPSGKNIHRFPNSKESDEWGVMPDKGYEVKLSDDELRKYLEYRRERDVLRDKGESKSDYKDPQLAKAVEWLAEKIKNPGKDGVMVSKDEPPKKDGGDSKKEEPKKDAEKKSAEKTDEKPAAPKVEEKKVEEKKTEEKSDQPKEEKPQAAAPRWNEIRSVLTPL